MSNYQTADREGHGLGYTMPQLEEALGEARRERDAARRAVTTGVETEDALRAENERLKAALRLVYGYAAAIQRMSVFAPIGFRSSLIRETVSRALPDDEAKRLHDETEIILDTLTEE